MATVEQLERRQADSEPLEGFARDVVAGLERIPRSIPSKYFYDARGSRLFQLITEQPEYYLTRCEAEILEMRGAEIARRICGPEFRLIELGAGDGRKTVTLLRKLVEDRCDFEFVPIDICPGSLRELATRAVAAVPQMAGRIRGLAGEYLEGLGRLGGDRSLRNVVLLLGSNIGNFSPSAATRFLSDVRQSLSQGDMLLVGFDLKKSIPLIRQAYNDARGVTREFNFNLLDRINRELGGDFQRGNFLHYAPYNANASCMESWLVSRTRQIVVLSSVKRQFEFDPWDAIQVERSYKYSIPEIESLALEAGFQIVEHYFDRRRYFADSLWCV